MAIRYIKDMDYEEIVALLHEDDDFRRKIEDHVIDFVGDNIIYHLEKAPRCIDWEVDRGFQRVWVHPRDGIGDCCDYDTLKWLNQIKFDAVCFCEDDIEKLDHLWDLRETLDSPESKYRWDEVSGKMEDELEEGVEYLLETISEVFTEELTNATDVENMADFVMANEHIYGDMAFGEEDEEDDEEDESPSGKVWDMVTLDAETMGENGLNFKTICEWYEYIEMRLDYLSRHTYNLSKRQATAIEEIYSAFPVLSNC